jgi:ligand-binding sensor domain-containing protein
MSKRKISFIFLFTFMICSYANSQFPGWTVYTFNSGPLGDNILTIAIDDSGNKWIGMQIWGLQKFNGSTWLGFDWSNYGSIEVNTVVIDNNKIIWVGAGATNPIDGGLAEFDGSNWTLYNGKNSGIQHVSAIAIDDSGNKWLGMYGWGLARFDGANWKVYNRSNSLLPDNVVNTIAIDDSGNKWIGTGGDGLAKFDGTNWIVYNISNSGLSSNRINSITIDKKGCKWIGTDSGIAKFDTSWTVYNTSNSGLPGNAISAIVIDKSGNKWIGAGGGGLVKFDGTNWTVFNQANSGLSDNDVQAIAIDSNGAKWIGTRYGGLAVFDEALSNQPTKETKQNPLAISCKYSTGLSRSIITLNYSVPENGTVCLQICSLGGRVMRTLVNSVKTSGNYSETWNGRNDNGETMAKGIYLYKLTNNNSTVFGKIRYFR